MSEERPFRFGVLGEGVRARQELVDTARAAEAAGYATFLLRDHIVAAPFGPQLAPLPALATVAAVTERLRIGTLVLSNDFRQPVMLAKEAATLDVLSGGRFELGLGAGWLRAEYEQAGLPFDRAGTRVDRLEESLRVLKGLFGDGPSSFTGSHYDIRDLTSFPRPVQRPHPPLLMGAGSPRMLKIAAREANIVNILNSSVTTGTLISAPAGFSPGAATEKVEWVREAAGARFDDVELSMVVSVTVTDEPREEAARYGARQGWEGVKADEVLAMPSVFIGPVARIAAEMSVRRERYGVSYFVVSDSDMDAFSPVVASLVGT